MVDKESATLGLSADRENQLPLHANHSQMCKFSSETDSDYMLVSKNLERFAEQALSNARPFAKNNLGEHIHITDLLQLKNQFRI